MLRQYTSITHRLEDPELAMYPLDVACVYHGECRQRAANHGLYINSLCMLKDIAEKQPSGYTHVDLTLNSVASGDDANLKYRFCSYFIVKDPVFMESDRAYLEARRLALAADERIRQIYIHGIWHTISVVVICLLCLQDMIMGLVFYLEISTNKNVLYFRGLPQIIQFFMSLGLMIWMISAKFCIKDKFGLYDRPSSLYRRQYFILAFYCISFIISIAEVSCLVHATVDQDTILSSGAKLFNLIGVFIACIVPLTFLTYAIVFCVLSRCEFKLHRWEWIFIDFLCMARCSCNRNNPDYIEMRHILDMDNDALPTDVHSRHPSQSSDHERDALLTSNESC